MPLLTVHYSSALAPGFDRKGFAVAVHTAASVLLDSVLAGFKMRFLAVDEAVVADGDLDQYLVHTMAEILPGRSRDVKHRVGEMLVAQMEKHVSRPDPLPIHITAEVRELQSYHQLVLS